MKLRWLVPLILLVCIAASTAQPMQHPIWDKGNVEKRWEEAKQKFNESREKYFEVLKEKREKVREKMEEVREKIFESRKRYYMSWAEMCERWVERLRVRVENMHMNEELRVRILASLNHSLERLKEIEERINSTTDYDELRQAVAEIRGVWLELRQELRFAVHSYIVEKFEITLERLKQVRDRLEANGIDVSTLDELIDKIEVAIDELKAAVGTPEFNEKVREVKELFVEAFKEVREITGARVLGYEAGFVYAKVDGSFELSGNFSLVQIKGVGNVTLPESSIVTKVEKDGELLVVARGELNASGEGSFRILAHGNGTLTLNGEGYYRVKPSPSEPMSEEKEFEGSETITFGVSE